MPSYKTSTQIQQAMDIRQILNALNVQRPLPTSHHNDPYQDLGPGNALCLSDASTQAKRKVVAPSSPRSRTSKPASTSPATPQAQTSGISERNPAERETNLLETSMLVPNPRSLLTNEAVEEGSSRLVTLSQTIELAAFITQNHSPAPTPRAPSRITKARTKCRRRGRVGGRELDGLKDWLSAPETSGLGSRGRTSWNSRSTWG